MARKQADVPHELDPLKGGLKHHPFAALREKLGAADAPAAHPVNGEQHKHVDGASGGKREGQVTGATDAKRVVARKAAAADERTPGNARASDVVKDSLRATGTASKSAGTNPRERVTVRMERTGRGGKTVTIAEGPALAGLPLEALARDIARGMGTGARARDGTIIVQGDQRERLVTWLGERSFPGAVAGN